MSPQTLPLCNQIVLQTATPGITAMLTGMSAGTLPVCTVGAARTASPTSTAPVLQVEWSTLIGPDPSKCYALIGQDQSAATPALLCHKDKV